MFREVEVAAVSLKCGALGITEQLLILTVITRDYKQPLIYKNKKMPSQEPPPSGGLEASQHAAVHPQRLQKINGKTRGDEGGGADPPASSTPRATRPTQTIPRGRQQQANGLTMTADIRTDNENIIRDIQSYLKKHQETLAAPTISLLQRAYTALLHSTHSHDVLQAVQGTQRTIQKDSQSPKTWTQTAAFPQSQRTPVHIHPMKTAPPESHHTIIRIREQKDKEEILKRSNTELVKDLKDPAIIAVKKLDSGDIRVFTNSKNAKEKISQNLEWIQKLCPSAEATEQTFQVLVHGVRIQAINAKSKDTCVQLQEENGRLHPHLQVRSITWLKSQKGMEGQKFSSLIVGLQNELQAKEVVAKGFVFQGTILLAEPFFPQQRATQCMKCAQFGHVAKHCRGRLCINTRGDCIQQTLT